MMNKKLKRKLMEREREISIKKDEEAHWYSRCGKFIDSKQGNGKSVHFSDGQRHKMFGKILTHNHPFCQIRETKGLKNTSYFSGVDLRFAHTYRLNQIRMAIGDERHCFSWRFIFRFIPDIYMLVVGHLRLFEIAYERAQDELDAVYRGKPNGVSLEEYYELEEFYSERVFRFMNRNKRWYNYKYDRCNASATNQKGGF